MDLPGQLLFLPPLLRRFYLPAALFIHQRPTTPLLTYPRRPRVVPCTGCTARTT